MATKGRPVYLGPHQAHACFEALMQALRKRANERPWTEVFGIADGGLPVSVHVAKHLGLPHHVLDVKGKGSLTTRMSSFGIYANPLFVDDIYDTGKTTANIMKAHKHWRYERRLTAENFAYLVARCRHHDPNRPRYFGRRAMAHEGWFVFPWEPSTP